MEIGSPKSSDFEALGVTEPDKESPRPTDIPGETTRFSQYPRINSCQLSLIYQTISRVLKED
jgi:hypothetical protein